MQPFFELGTQIERAFAAVDHDDEQFSRIALSALNDHRIHERVSAEQLISWALLSGELRPQPASRFGQPPLYVFMNSRFLIEVLFWLDGTTSIHQHSFDGAFGVLAGASVHSEYSFELERTINVRLLLGKLRFQRAELLEPGALRPIRSGDRSIHCLFHLDRPSLSIVVRTHHDARGPQYKYLKPGLAYDPTFEPEPLTRQLALLDAVQKFDPTQYASLLSRMLPTADAWLTFRLLLAAQRQLGEGPALARVVGSVAARHGELLGPLLDAAKYAAQVEAFAGLRATVHDIDERFLLALLVNVPSRSQILSLVAARYPGENPAKAVLARLVAMIEHGALGLAATPLSNALLGLLIAGHSFAAASTRLRAHLDRELDEDELARAHHALRSTPLLQPLLGD